MARKNTKKVMANNTAKTVKNTTPVVEMKALVAEVKTPATEVKTPATEMKTPVEEKAVVEEKKAVVKTEETQKRGRKPGTKAGAKTVKEDGKTENVFVESAGYQYKTKDVVDKVRAAWVAEGHRAGSVKSLNIYINMDERRAYYVINDKNTGSVEL